MIEVINKGTNYHYSCTPNNDERIVYCLLRKFILFLTLQIIQELLGDSADPYITWIQGFAFDQPMPFIWCLHTPSDTLSSVSPPNPSLSTKAIPWTHRGPYPPESFPRSYCDKSRVINRLAMPLNFAAPLALRYLEDPREGELHAMLAMENK